MDLCSDYSRLVAYWMKQKGIQSDKTGWELWYEFFNLQKKGIVPRKRNILYSKEFSCPKELKKGLDILVKKLENGVDVSLHLSRKAAKASDFDGLLYEWGIYHLHLGDGIDTKTGYIQRTGPVLFAKIDVENVYLINVYSHGNGATPPWCKQEMLKILHDNWPDSIKNYRLPDGVKSLEPLSDDQYAKARKSHTTTAVEVAQNAVYFGPGGGYTSSGHSLEIMMLCQRINNTLKQAEIEIKNNLLQYVKILKNTIDCWGMTCTLCCG